MTAFHVQLHDLGPVVPGGMLMYPAAMAGELVKFWRDFMTAAVAPMPSVALQQLLDPPNPRGMRNY